MDVSAKIERAYSLLTIKSVNTEQRIISGIASTPEVDRMGDIVEPGGAKFAGELPLLLFHDTRLPVGTVRLSKSAEGIGFEAKFPQIAEPISLRDRIAEAWGSIKAGLIKGVSIGFRPLENGIEVMKGGGLKFTNFEVLELSLVSVPANASASIQTIKSIDAMYLKTAVPPHSTATTDRPWDGPGNVAQLAPGKEATWYRAFAWYDGSAPDPNNDGYPDAKSAYKFPHHEVGSDGSIGAANISACQTGIAVLNGSRGGANIPDSDRAGVHRHLARHLEDAGLKPAPLKSFTPDHLAATGKDDGFTKPGATGAHAARPARVSMAKTISEQIKDYEATRAAKAAQMADMMTAAADRGETLDAAQSDEYDSLEIEVKAVDAHVTRLKALEQANIAQAKAVEGTSVEKAATSRSDAPVISVKENRPAGIGFARAAMCQMRAHMDHRYVVDVARESYPSDQELHAFLKAAVPAGTSTQTVWAGPLVYATNLASEFVEFLRPQTIIGRLNLRRVPFNVRFTGQTSGGTGYWVGEGAAKPLTSFAFTANTLGVKKVAAISVITQELARFSTPSAEALVRDALAASLVERIDISLVDPAHAVSSASPASLTNGLTALSSSGTAASNVVTDIGVLLNQFLADNQNPANLVLIMPNTLAMAISLMTNALGQPEFPGMTISGGTLKGIPVIASQYAANASGGGNLVIAVNQSEVFLADDGQVTVDASTEASLEMSDAPSSNSGVGNGVSVVSMYQTNSIALRAERFINWAKRRAEAVAYMDDVNWGNVGSPA